MAQVNYTVDELVGMQRRSELRLPEIQRRYVWKATRVRDLMDSLYRGYPSGSILMWETDEPVPTREFAIKPATDNFAGTKLLLDGQQRVTSLAALMSGDKVKVRGRKYPIDILFNLEHPEGLSEVTEVDEDEDDPLEEPDAESDVDTDDEDEAEDTFSARFNKLTFVVSSKRLAAKPNWVSVREIFNGKSDTELLRAAGLKGWDDPRYERYQKRIEQVRKIKDYSYVVHVLPRALGYNEVTEIFVRVNSLGVKLRSSDLALAQISSRWRNVLAELETFQEECEKSQFTLDTGLLVRAMVVFATRQSLFRAAANLSEAQLKEGWKHAQEALRFAVNFLSKNAGVEDESLLTAPTLMIPLGVFSQLRSNKLTAVESSDLLRWFHLANVRGRYSRGSSETLLNQDLNELFSGLGLVGLHKNLKQQVGRLEVTSDDFKGRGVGTPVFKASYLALRQVGACDWYSGLNLSMAHQGKLHYIQYHHIFPKSLLKDLYSSQDINEVANFAFIGGQTNRRISNKLPEAYLRDIAGDMGRQAPQAKSDWQCRLDFY
ncbi:DUF262 domain-containing protein [Lysobacter sp. KIS68-7]|uniref:DUF262 domain-containing protein n=1 Tax=Lysobacter sp. KIS68-7 TaxID=2904252 RepID=UPI001E55ABEE|nr:DUF262 domain-containing protein [Lysobacter sp. KIS68-7]UHQ19596.1 DUF262 domain-containing protein [Lysobacter sp. KIS68-7]